MPRVNRGRLRKRKTGTIRSSPENFAGSIAPTPRPRRRADRRPAPPPRAICPFRLPRKCCASPPACAVRRRRVAPRGARRHGGESLGKNAVDLIGSAVIMLDDAINDLGHGADLLHL